MTAPVPREIAKAHCHNGHGWYVAVECPPGEKPRLAYVWQGYCPACREFFNGAETLHGIRVEREKPS